jgi:NADH:ubiquinone oxidoreductase subunit 2 (subunit N)
VSLYYYLTVIRWMYIERPTAEVAAVPPIRISAAANAVLMICTAGMLLLGMLPQILRWVESAAAAGF